MAPGAMRDGDVKKPVCPEFRNDESKKDPKHLGWRWLTAAGVAIAVVTGIVVIGGAKAQNSAPVRDASSKTALQKYAHDLTAAAEQGRLIH